MSNLKVEIKGKHKLDYIKERKIRDGVYFLQIVFDAPKYFELLSQCTGITVFPRDAKDELIEIEITSKTIKVEDYRIFSDGARYIIDAILIKKSLLEIM